MASHESLLTESLALDHYRVGRYCKPVDENFLREVNRKKPETMARLAGITAYIEIPKKNGKSELAAAVALLLVRPAWAITW